MANEIPMTAEDVARLWAELEGLKTEGRRRVWVQLPSAYPWAHLWPRLARAGPG